MLAMAFSEEKLQVATQNHSPFGFEEAIVNYVGIRILQNVDKKYYHIIRKKCVD